MKDEEGGRNSMFGVRRSMFRSTFHIPLWPELPLVTSSLSGYLPFAMDNTFSTPGGPPPPPVAPPPVITPPPPPRPAKSHGWMIFSIILIVLLCLSVFVIFVMGASRAVGFTRQFQPPSGRDVGPQLEEVTLKDNDSSAKIAVITVDGIITSHQADEAGNNMVEVIKAQLDEAKKDDKVKAAILKVDSPGGEVMASDEIYRAIKKFQSGTDGKPVICSMGSLAASGGYYISSPCRWIVADELTLTGSIGVIMETINYRGLMDKIGVEPYVFKSGKYKDMLSGMRETNEIPAGEHAMVQGLIDQTFGKFKQVVADGRDAAHEKNKDEGQPLAPDWKDYADGRVVSGDQALQLGLVDELGGFDDAVDRAKKIAGIKNANLIEYRETYDISNFLRLFGQSGATHVGSVKVDLGFELPRLQMGEPYFLYMPTAD
ncbi:MAG TPA: signal peptide peptidase SppA [Verrucomicrobiae bacterium]|nr:signal peptide peptidase SppA [Verrucomicrobiae bacterium]